MKGNQAVDEQRHHHRYLFTALAILVVVLPLAAFPVISLRGVPRPAEAASDVYSTPNAVEGRVTDQDGNPLPGITVSLYQKRCVSNNIPVGCAEPGRTLYFLIGVDTTDANGDYGITYGTPSSPSGGGTPTPSPLPGNYGVPLPPPDNYQVTFVDPGDQYMSESRIISLDPSVMPVEPLVLDMTMEQQSAISGQVTDLMGDPLANVQVSVTGGSDGSAHTDQYGNYVINGLHSGNYVVQFWPYQNFAGEYYDNQQDYSAATPVPVAPHSNVTGIDAELTASSCSGQIPDLQLAVADVYWNSYPDYTAGQLSVAYELSNTGTIPALVAFTGAVNSDGVTVVTPMPARVGPIGPGYARRPGIVYHVPPSVTVFRTSIYAAARDTCGNMFYYPGPYPGA